jgi:Fur family ferric uptake transcriptional regulator
MNQEYKWFWDRLEAYLAQNQLKQTKQRRMIVEEFVKMNAHVQAEQLYIRVNVRGAKVGLATIYRTLNLLKEAGLIEQCVFSDGRSVFELATPGQHHDHLVCLDCGDIAEFENEAIEQLQKEIASERQFILYSHRLYLYGSCRKCQIKNPRKASVA